MEQSAVLHDGKHSAATDTDLARDLDRHGIHDKHDDTDDAVERFKRDNLRARDIEVSLRKRKHCLRQCFYLGECEHDHDSFWVSAERVKYRWDMQATDSSGVSGWSSPLYFTTGSIPPLPTPISPGTSTDTGYTINTTTPTMQWSGSNTTTYELAISQSPYGTANVVYDNASISGSATTITIPAGTLQNGVKYRWNMQATNGSGVSGWSTWLYFTVNTGGVPPAPQLISPGTPTDTEYTVNTTTPTMQWSGSNATTYELSISQYPYGSAHNVYDNTSISGTANTITIPAGYLTSGVKYRWDMRATNNVGVGPWGTWLFFEVDTSGGSTPSTVTLLSSISPAPYGASLTFTAQVSPTTGTGTPTGNVAFFDSGNPLAVVPLNTGTASMPDSSLSVGSHKITASYGGDSVFAPSTSAVLTQQITKATSAVALTSNPNPSSVNQFVTLTATVTSQYGGTPTGSVTFKQGTTTLGTAQLASAQGTLTYTFPTAGSFNIAATYTGDTNFKTSTSAQLTQTVMPPAFLSFPLQYRTAWTAKIVTVFDHSAAHQYCASGTVTAYDGEQGQLQYGEDQYPASGFCVLTQPPEEQNLYGLAQENYAPFYINNQYVGADGDGTHPGVDFLEYEGHPGFDYVTRDQGSGDGKIPVLAAADGIVICSNVPNTTTTNLCGGSGRDKNQTCQRRSLNLSSPQFNFCYCETVRFVRAADWGFG